MLLKGAKLRSPAITRLIYALVYSLAFASIFFVLYLEWLNPTILGSDFYSPITLLADISRNSFAEGVQHAWLRNHYVKQSFQRVQLLQSMGNVESFAMLYNVIVPEVQCPDMIRIGSVDDGGKYVCNPLALPKEHCTIYSLGLCNEISFELEIQKITGKRCIIYGYDLNEQVEAVISAYKSINGVIEAKAISEAIGHRIEDVFDSHNDTFADILKVDIEGDERTTVLPFLSNGKYKICQLLIEIHGDPLTHLRLLTSIAKIFSNNFMFDYALFSYEINGSGLTACEYCFIHVSCMKHYGAVELSRYLNLVNV